MGLFNFQDPEQAGLLALGSGLLSAGGPSPRPISFGQALGSSMMGAMEAASQADLMQQRKAAMARQAEQDALQNKLYGMKVQEMETGMQRQKGLNDALSSFGQPDVTAALSAPGRVGPTPERLPLLGQAEHSNPYNHNMALAKHLESKGFAKEAGEIYERALKFQPKVKNWQEVRKGDQVLFAPFFEDGTAGQPVPMEVARKMEFRDFGGTVGGLDPYTGKVGFSEKKTLSPGEAANVASAAASRAQAERHFQAGLNTPQYMETSEGIVALPKKLAPGQAPVGTPVFGADGNPLQKKQNIPQFVIEGVGNNTKTVSVIDSALSSLGTDAGKKAVGMKAFLPQGPLNYIDPEGVQTRADIADVGSLTIKDRSGATVTIGESPRLMPFIPQPTDDHATATKKLNRMKQIIQSETDFLTAFYPSAKKIAGAAHSGGAAGSAGGGLTAAEQQELDALRKQLGR